ncbi:hypothetical protein LLS1_05120 [Leifsonia sp. LS1]|nr:hypothetical protein LLS1_05120 [Leifsonia sp. LS1]
MWRTTKFASAIAVAVVAGIGAVAGAPPANSAPPVENSIAPEVPTGAIDGPLDPSTFEGEIVVAVPSGHEIVVSVEKGEAPAVIAQVRSDDAAGAAPTRGRMGQCPRLYADARDVHGRGRGSDV